MKITAPLKQKLMALAFSIIFGQMSDLNALADTLETIAEEARRQASA